MYRMVFPVVNLSRSHQYSAQYIWLFQCLLYATGGNEAWLILYTASHSYQLHTDGMEIYFIFRYFGILYNNEYIILDYNGKMYLSL